MVLGSRSNFAVSLPLVFWSPFLKPSSFVIFGVDHVHHVLSDGYHSFGSASQWAATVVLRVTAGLLGRFTL